MLRLVLADDERRAAARLLAHAARDGSEDVLFGVVEDALRGVDAEAVEVELADPVRGVRDEELAEHGRDGVVEVQRLEPLRTVPLGEVAFGELAGVVAFGAEVVINHVEDDGYPAAVRLVDEAAQVVGLAVEARRREQVNAVVAPAEFSGELRDRHHLDARHARAGQLPQLARRRGPSAFARERADVHLVDDLPAAAGALPTFIRPGEVVRADDARGAVRPSGLEARGGVRVKTRAVAVEPEAVERAFAGLGGAGREVAAAFGLQLKGLGRARALEDDFDPPAPRRPHAEMDPAALL